MSKGIYIDNINLNELQALIAASQQAAYKQGYLDAVKLLEAKKNADKFGEILAGVKELHSYLLYKHYITPCSLSFIEKVAPQLLKTTAAEKQGKRLLFHTYLIDRLFEGGYKFVSLKKQPKKTSKRTALLQE